MEYLGADDCARYDDQEELVGQFRVLSPDEKFPLGEKKCQVKGKAEDDAKSADGDKLILEYYM
jgi:hypothetical protein